MREDSLEGRVTALETALAVLILELRRGRLINEHTAENARENVRNQDMLGLEEKALTLDLLENMDFCVGVMHKDVQSAVRRSVEVLTAKRSLPLKGKNGADLNT